MMASYHLQVAVGDLAMSRDLAHAAVRHLVREGTVTEAEYAQHFQLIQRSAPDQHITVTQLAHLLAQNAQFYGHTEEEPALMGNE